MGKLEKRNLLPSNCRYFDNTFIEMIFEKFCFNHIFLAYCSFVLVAMETIMQNMENENTEKYLLRNNTLYETETL